MSINRDEALRAKDMAEGLMKKLDFPAARKLALKAQKMDSSLDKISQMIMVCEVHCAATQNFCGTGMDWYGILQVEENADDSMVKKQYRRLALLLHPDKNKFPGAESAFQLVGEAHSTLLDRHKRMLHDINRSRWRPPPPPPPPYKTQQMPNYHTQPVFTKRPEHPPTASSTAKNTGKRKRVIIESSESSDSESSSESEDVVILSDDDVEEVQEEKQQPEDDVTEGQEKKQTYEDDVTEGHSEKQTHEDDSSTKRIFYDAPDFSDFDKLREKSCFQAGQIWAVYDEEEGMPRFYAVIREVRTLDFMLQYVWLEVDQDKENERPNLPVSVGKFEVGDMEQTNRCSIFSHLVCSTSRRVTRGRKFTVFPKKGETWALFKNWDINWSADSVSPSKYEYDFVEILSDHDAEGTKVSVGFLSKVKGFKCVFCPMPKDNSCEIPPHEFCRFSHRIPSFRLSGTEGRGVTEGWYELDPAALPVE